MIVAEPRTQTLNGTTQAGPDLRRAVLGYVRAYASLHGRRKAAEDLGVSRHTLWRFLERGHMGRAVPSAVLSSVGGSVRAIEAATFEIIVDLEGLRPDPALRSLRQGLEEALLLLCAAPLGGCPRNNVLSDMRHQWSVKMLITPRQSPDYCKQVIAWRFSPPGTNPRTDS